VRKEKGIADLDQSGVIASAQLLAAESIFGTKCEFETGKVEILKVEMTIETR
jgi:hypothetical protein